MGVVVSGKTGLRCRTTKKRKKESLFSKARRDGFLIRAESQVVTNVSAVSSCSDFRRKNQKLFLSFSPFRGRFLKEMPRLYDAADHLCVST